MIRKVPPALTLGVVALWVGTVAGQQYPDNLSLDDPAIQYHRASEADPVARLTDRLGRGSAVLQFRQDGTGYLASALTQLGITVDSQVFVFSKTSMQATRISPRNPRAIYFTDDVAVGFVRGGNVLEFAAVNPQQGVMFYTLPNQDPAEEPVLSRREGCLRCHQGPATAGVPGMFVSSVYPRASGFPSRLGAIVTDHRTAFEDRWGGWYVNGHTGTMRHRGNAVGRNLDRPDTLDLEGAANLLDLHRKIDPAGYLSSVSDIVALMTLEHQTQMTNLLTRLGWRARIARHGSGRDVASRLLTSDITDLVAYMLFVDEPLLKEPVTGASSFARTFVRRGPRDNRGRSLREFDLTRRLFRYPLSYMVYSAAFDALPDDMRNEVYGLLFDVLVGKNRHPRFTRLPVDDRMAILEIVRDTKSDLPLYWREIAPSVTTGSISDVATRRPAANGSSGPEIRTRDGSAMSNSFLLMMGKGVSAVRRGDAIMPISSQLSPPPHGLRDQCRHNPEVGRVRRRAQPGAAAFGVSGTDALRDVFRHRGRGARGLNVPRRPPSPRGGQPLGILRDVPGRRRGRVTTAC